MIACQLADQLLLNQSLCFHTLRTVELVQMQQILLALYLGLPVHIHIAEQRKEVNDCLAWSGQWPVAQLYEHLPVDQC